MAKAGVQPPQKNMSRVWIVLGILLGLFVLSSILVGCMSLFVDGDSLAQGNVLVIPIHGTITSTSSGGLFSSDVVSADEVIKAINKAESDPAIEGVIFDINSPGGSAVGSEEIATAVSSMKKPTVARIREVGASGAFWIAVSCDYVVASRMSITGSVGVISSYLEFARLMDEYNVTYQRLVAGKYKDMGSPFTDLKPDERALFQNKLDIIQGYFLDYVQKRRNLSDETRGQISTGVFFLGSEAYGLRLVDQLGGEEEAKAYLHTQLNKTIETKLYQSKRTIFDAVGVSMNGFAYQVGKGIGQNLVEQEDFVPRT